MSDQSPFALALGMGSLDPDNNWLEVFFPQPQIHPNREQITQIYEQLNWEAGNEWRVLEGEALKKVLSTLKMPDEPWLSSLAPVVIVILSKDVAPQSVPAVYLKLHLLSHRLCAPHTINLEGLFALLPTVAWTSQGALAMTELAEKTTHARARKTPLKIYSVDKFPPLADYVVPPGVRIADTARVRLGAWIGEGTTIMHEGFINFNAGTEGPNMIEGRISAGVVVGAGSDLGGGSSTMGTLSGGNKTLISVGKNCLIGANAGTGIPLGDGCTIEAGLYVTASTIVTRIDDKSKAQEQCKARELAGVSNLLFRRNARNGAIEALPNRRAIALNEHLHSHN